MLPKIQIQYPNHLQMFKVANYRAAAEAVLRIRKFKRPEYFVTFRYNIDDASDVDVLLGADDKEDLFFFANQCRDILESAKNGSIAARCGAI